MRRICVFCGSAAGRRPAYAEAAVALGRALAEQNLGLIYGGGAVGLMGILADTVMKAGGEVIGVIPEALLRLEVGHSRLTELRIVADMHERKAMMADLADAFITLPGGIGTLEEMFEIWTWGQLGLHPKPLAILDVAGYFRHMHDFLDHAVEEGFLRPVHRDMVAVCDSPQDVLAHCADYTPPTQPKIISRRDR